MSNNNNSSMFNSSLDISAGNEGGIEKVGIARDRPSAPTGNIGLSEGNVGGYYGSNIFESHASPGLNALSIKIGEELNKQKIKTISEKLSVKNTGIKIVKLGSEGSKLIGSVLAVVLPYSRADVDNVIFLKTYVVIDYQTIVMSTQPTNNSYSNVGEGVPRRATPEMIDDTLSAELIEKLKSEITMFSESSYRYHYEDAGILTIGTNEIPSNNMSENSINNISQKIIISLLKVTNRPEKSDIKHSKTLAEMTNKEVSLSVGGNDGMLGSNSGNGNGKFSVLVNSVTPRTGNNSWALNTASNESMYSQTTTMRTDVVPNTPVITKLMAALNNASSPNNRMEIDATEPLLTARIEINDIYNPTNPSSSLSALAMGVLSAMGVGSTGAYLNYLTNNLKNEIGPAGNVANLAIAQDSLYRAALKEPPQQKKERDALNGTNFLKNINLTSNFIGLSPVYTLSCRIGSPESDGLYWLKNYLDTVVWTETHRDQAIVELRKLNTGLVNEFQKLLDVQFNWDMNNSIIVNDTISVYTDEVLMKAKGSSNFNSGDVGILELANKLATMTERTKANKLYLDGILNLFYNQTGGLMKNTMYTKRMVQSGLTSDLFGENHLSKLTPYMKVSAVINPEFISVVNQAIVVSKIKFDTMSMPNIINELNVKSNVTIADIYGHNSVPTNFYTGGPQTTDWDITGSFRL